MLARIRGKIIGSVQVGKEESMASFNMLAVSPEVQGQRIGVALVQAVENWARSEGFKTMKLEMLSPIGWKHKFKEVLRKWYMRMGYVPQKNVKPLSEYCPSFDKIATCEIIITDYLKPL